MELAAMVKDFGQKINIFTAHGIIGRANETSNRITAKAIGYELTHVTLRPCEACEMAY